MQCIHVADVLDELPACVCSVSTDFADVSPKLRELCEIVSPHLLTILNTTLTTEYGQVQVGGDGVAPHILNGTRHTLVEHSALLFHASCFGRDSWWTACAIAIVITC